MVNVNGDRGEVEAYEHRPLDHLVVQDAVVIIAVYAAQIDPESSEADIAGIEAILESCPLCVEKKAGITTRINRFVNLMRAVEPESALEKAIAVLDPESRVTAFALAADVVASTDFSAERKVGILKTLAAKMSIDAETAAGFVDPVKE